MRRYYRKGKSILHDIGFIVRNVHAASRLPVFSDECVDEIRFRAFRKTDLVAVESIYKLLNEWGGSFGCATRILLKLSGAKLCLVVEKEGHGVIAFNLFYFTPRDIKEGTIHNAFDGILPDYQGMRIGSRLYAHALDHFSKTVLPGISGRISMSNPAPFKIATRLGYKIVEKYFDQTLNEERAYVRLYFSELNHSS